MKIAEMAVEDVEEIKGLARKAILESVTAEKALKQEIIFDTNRHINENIGGDKCVFLKCHDEKIAGFILIQDFWNLSDLFVHPEIHRRGIGKLLFRSAESICKANANRGYIRVNSSLNAEAFYRGLGFRSFVPEKEVPDFVVPLIYNF
jgi:GNAT superfamily N-acetyltransferase